MKFFNLIPILQILLETVLPRYLKSVQDVSGLLSIMMISGFGGGLTILTGWFILIFRLTVRNGYREFINKVLHIC